MTYLKYDLQRFAKDGPGGEKTEPATAKKKEDARKDGNVPKSKEIVSSVSLLICFIFLKYYIGTIGTGLIEDFWHVYNMIGTLGSAYSDEVTIASATNVLEDALWFVLKSIAPILILTAGIAFFGNAVQFKWKVTAKPLQPKFDKFSPLKGVKRVFSMQTLVNLGKSIALVGIIGYVVIQELLSKGGILLTFYELSLNQAISVIGNTALNLAIKISAIYIIVGVIDLVYQRHKFNEDLKMTKQEVKEEYKNAEGDPQVKSQIKRRMMQASQRRMMQSVPEADVVITNPTHFAVAIKYDANTAAAPIVLAKGADYLAQKIKEIARDNKVEIVENKPLARALYANVEVGMEIPEELYQAVAEVLATVYKLKGRR